MTERSDRKRDQILSLSKEFYEEEFLEKEFIPGETQVPVSGRVFDSDEIIHLVDSSLDCWLTMGRFAAQFEKKFAEFFGLHHAILVNSGSSANLLAISALTSPRLKDRQLVPGDEIITVAAGFPTTVNAIVQNSFVPVFLDIELGTYNVNPKFLEEAVGPRTKAIFLAHTLGNPFDLDVVMDVAKRHDLFVVEDNCDALGSKYRDKLTGTFGDVATASFYPAHHITMGEGGCVFTNNGLIKIILESFRDWGRDCWCDPGKENTCGKRFDWQLGDLPRGYDHKYIYSHIGYNLKATDMQAAVGVAQLKKLSGFIEKRKANFQFLFNGLKKFEEVLILPETNPIADPSWFGFPVTVREDAPFSRIEMVNFLDARKIATRFLFGGNLLRQPAYKDIKKRVIGELINSDKVMRQTFWLGVYPGLTEKMLGFVVSSIRDFIRNF